MIFAFPPSVPLMKGINLYSFEELSAFPQCNWPLLPQNRSQNLPAWTSGMCTNTESEKSSRCLKPQNGNASLWAEMQNFNAKQRMAAPLHPTLSFGFAFLFLEEHIFANYIVSLPSTPQEHITNPALLKHWKYTGNIWTTVNLETGGRVSICGALTLQTHFGFVVHTTNIAPFDLHQRQHF